MMLDQSQIVDLLTYAAVYDGRRPSEAMILAWAEAADRAHWDPEGALNALHEHYAVSTDYVMPGHLTAILKRDRAQPAPYAGDALALTAGYRPGPAGHNPSGPPASPEHIRKIMSDLAAQLGWDSKINQEDQP